MTSSLSPVDKVRKKWLDRRSKPGGSRPWPVFGSRGTTAGHGYDGTSTGLGSHGTTTGLGGSHGTSTGLGGTHNTVTGAGSHGTNPGPGGIHNNPTGAGHHATTTGLGGTTSAPGGTHTGLVGPGDPSNWVKPAEVDQAAWDRAGSVVSQEELDRFDAAIAALG